MNFAKIEQAMRIYLFSFIFHLSLTTFQITKFCLKKSATIHELRHKYKIEVTYLVKKGSKLPQFEFLEIWAHITNFSKTYFTNPAVQIALGWTYKGYLFMLR